MIKIVIAGTPGSGKSAIARVVSERLKGLNCDVTLRDSEGGHSTVTSEKIIRDKKPEVEITTTQLARNVNQQSSR